MTARSTQNFRRLACSAPLASLALTGAAPAQDGEPTGITADVPPGFVLVHGDILIPEGEFRGGFSPTAWPDGIVYFEFDANVTAENRLRVYDAMDEWHDSGADVVFVPRTVGANDDYVHIQSSDTTNNSSIGVRGGEQFINIRNWGAKFTIVHELCHTLGFWHEQSRPDRDTFVTIQWGNIDPDHTFNFDHEPNWLTLATDYDFDSVMHYNQFAFTTCAIPTPGLCETIIVRPPNEDQQWNIGQRDHISALDAADMQDVYGTDHVGPRFIDWTRPPDAETGSLRYPFRSFQTSVIAPNGAEYWVRGGSYDAGAGLTLNKPGTYRAHNGEVRVQ